MPHLYLVDDSPDAPVLDPDLFDPARYVRIEAAATLQRLHEVMRTALLDLGAIPDPGRRATGVPEEEGMGAWRP